MSSARRVSHASLEARLAHRMALERELDPRARALLVALEEWLPREVAWERAVTISEPLIVLAGAQLAPEDEHARDPIRAITAGLSDVAALGGRNASPARIMQAVRAWASAGRVSGVVSRQNSD